jgi:two-component system sensor histidine kinase NblS
MTRLIDQLLTLARADANVEVFNFEPTNLPELLEEVAEEWRERFADAQIHFTCDFSTREFWVDADYLALKRLLGILLENAWRYTRSGESVTLFLREPMRIEGRRSIDICVADTGIGIARDDQIRIFERFCHIAAPIHGDFSGSGLGLALGQSIAERHNTKIKLQSAMEEGSCFSFLMYESLARIIEKQPDAGQMSRKSYL